MIEAKQVKFNLCNESEKNYGDLSCSSFGSGVRMPPLCGAFNRLLGPGGGEIIPRYVPRVGGPGFQSTDALGPIFLICSKSYKFLQLPSVTSSLNVLCQFVPSNGVH